MKELTLEEKELLLKDLCARLPYGVIGEYSWKGNEPHNRELTGNLYDELNSSWSSTGDSKFIPYLRPMSSITEEEEDEYYNIEFDFNIHSDRVDWLNAHHFDYRGLIEKGLAIAVTEENNPYKD
jgi:hypothetical protein